MQPSIRLSLSLAGTAALALAHTPFAVRSAAAEEIKVAQSTGSLQKPGSAVDLGVMDINLKDAVKLN